MEYYVFNHYYKLRHDRHRTFIMSSGAGKSMEDVDTEWTESIHPIYAMILSFFSRPITLLDVTEKIAKFLSIKKETANSLVRKMVENKDYFHINYKGYENNFPKRLIIPADDLKAEIVDYTPAMFKYEKVDLDTIRIFEAPLDLTFMVNNTCLTDCIYCYANKSHRCKNMDFSLVKKIIKEARDIGIRNFSVDGGEFFIYPYWRELLQELKNHHYTPNLVSTKYPISESDIKKFSEYNVSLQISLDSLNPNVLEKMVGKIPHYAERMQETIRTVDKYIPFQVATILTKYNGNIQNLEEMFEQIKSLKHIRKWDIRVGFKSLYTKQNFSDFQIERSHLQEIQEWAVEKQKEVSFNLQFVAGREVNFFKSEEGSKSFIGARCSANSMHMFILPDGQVTICEQLYWKKEFLIGDLKEQSISEVWNSPRALYLANLSQSDYSNESACKSCELLDSCNAYMNKCYANILKVYGDEHWDYPDPRCVHASRDVLTSIYV